MGCPWPVTGPGIGTGLGLGPLLAGVAAGLGVLLWPNSTVSGDEEQRMLEAARQGQPQPQQAPSPTTDESEPDDGDSCTARKARGEIDRECWELEQGHGYQHYGPSADEATDRALDALRKQNPDGRLEGYNQATTDSGPCEGKGSHTNVRDTTKPTGSEYVGSIVCCPCCTDEAGGPLNEWICGIV